MNPPREHARHAPVSKRGIWVKAVLEEKERGGSGPLFVPLRAARGQLFSSSLLK